MLPGLCILWGIVTAFECLMQNDSGLLRLRPVSLRVLPKARTSDSHWPHLTNHSKRARKDKESINSHHFSSPKCTMHLHPRIGLNHTKPIIVLIRMIRLLMFLILHIQPHNPSIRVFAPQNPGLNTREYPAMFHVIRIESGGPALKVVPRADSICDRIPAFLRSSLTRDVAYFNG
jgi:hypothetical protein